MSFNRVVCVVLIPFILAIALESNDSVAAEAATTDNMGRKLYVTQHGAPLGYPGCFDDKKEQVDKETGETKLVPKYPIWGHPELENYPGSVEHFRTKAIKYLPALNPFNAKTLVRNWVMGEQNGVATESFAEPIYYMPMYGNPVFTDKHREPVKVHRLKRDGSNAITLSLGKLPQSMYAVRVIAAIQVPPKDWAGDPEVLVLTASLNDGPDSKVRSWTRRHRAVDQFYAVGEWYFHAVDDREIRFELKLDAESEIDLLVHNVDLHDVLAESPAKIIKRKATVYTAESRAAAQAHYAKHGKVSRAWGHNTGLPRAKGLWNGEPLEPEARRERDDLLWNLLPPTMVNLHSDGPYGKYDQYELSEEQIEKIGKWEIPFQTRYRRNWDKPRTIVNKKLNLEYTLDAYLAGKPLPKPYPYQDRGFGVRVSYNGYHNPVFSLLRNTDANYKLFGHAAAEAGDLCIEYFNRNNENVARDAALLLIRAAYTIPAGATQRKRVLQQVVCRPAQCFGFNDPVNRRFTGHRINGIVRMARVYDLLFDFIKDNDELAQAAGRFIPWVKTSDDLRAFLDQRILTWGMNKVLEHRVTSSHQTPLLAIEMAILADNPEATGPLMEYLVTRTWDYPLPLSGVQDYMVTGTTRDGTTTIGSFAYTAGGSPFLKVATQLKKYIANGGDRKYDLSDLRRYPKPFFGAYFNLEARVAGYWPVGVGDVGGVMSHGHWFSSQEDAVRTGWESWRDPKLAWTLKHFFGRKHETDKQWEQIEKAAINVKRNPWMSNRSRALSTWAGILEGGQEHDDFRFRRAVTMRVGVGWGHSHRDTLDLQIYAMGCQMTPDGGQRPGYGRPDAITTMNHNVVEVDGDGGRHAGNWEGTAWISTLADLPGSPMMHGKTVPPHNKPQVRLHERTVAMIDVDPGRHSSRVPSDSSLGVNAIYGKDIILPKSYVFDVSRVAGGKRHTYGFHGCPEDEFNINASNPQPVPLPGEADEPSLEVSYLRKYVLSGHQGAGDAPDTLVATWRMARDPYKFETVSGKIDEGKVKVYTCPAPEQSNLKANFDPASPRKFTRLHLLGQENARVLWGRWVSAPYTGNSGKWFTQIHVMHDGEQDRESVFPAVIETYAGSPAVKATQLLTVQGNETDALRAVAVAVETTNGHHDLLFADGRPASARKITSTNMGGAAELSGQFAYVSRDENGLRQASIVGGSHLVLPGLVTIKPAQTAYESNVTKVDHLGRWFEIDTKLPAPAAGHAFWEVGNSDRRTSLEVKQVKDGARVHFRKGLELVSTRVRSVDAEKGIVTGKLVSILMGAEEDNGIKPGMTAGLWATNDKMNKWWRCEYLGGTRANGYQYQLTGAPVAEKDFPVNGSLRIFELGAGDQARLATSVSIRRHPVFAELMQLTSNVACELSLPTVNGSTVEVSSDQLSWCKVDATKAGDLVTLNLTAEDVATGPLLIRFSAQ